MRKSKEDKLLFICVYLCCGLSLGAKVASCFALSCAMISRERCLSRWIPCIIKQVLFYEPILFLWFCCPNKPFSLVLALLLISITLLPNGKRKKNWKMKDESCFTYFCSQDMTDSTNGDSIHFSKENDSSITINFKSIVDTKSIFKICGIY